MNKSFVFLSLLVLVPRLSYAGLHETETNSPVEQAIQLLIEHSDIRLFKPMTNATQESDDRDRMPASQEGATQSIQMGQPNKLVPGVIEAEDFDRGFDTTSGNFGNSNYRPQTDVDISETDQERYVSFIDSGEFLEYDLNVKEDGVYEVTSRVANPYQRAHFYLRFDEQLPVIAMPLPSTSTFEDFKNTSPIRIELSKGPHILRIYFDEDLINLDHVNFSRPSHL